MFLFFFLFLGFIKYIDLLLWVKKNYYINLRNNYLFIINYYLKILVKYLKFVIYLNSNGFYLMFLIIR